MTDAANSPSTDLDSIATEPKVMRLSEIAAGHGGVNLANLNDMWTLAQSICRAGMQPRNGKEFMTPAQVMIGIQMGAEVGLPPMTALKNIAIINGRPSIWGDALLALAFRKNLIETIEEDVLGEGDQRAAVCTIKRRGMKQPVVRSFSVKDAKQAGLWGKPGPWQGYPDRMLAMRARGFCLRDAVPDALGGFTLVEEMQDVRFSGEETTTRTEALLTELRTGEQDSDLTKAPLDDSDGHSDAAT